MTRRSETAKINDERSTLHPSFSRAGNLLQVSPEYFSAFYDSEA